MLCTQCWKAIFVYNTVKSWANPAPALEERKGNTKGRTKRTLRRKKRRGIEEGEREDS